MQNTRKILPPLDHLLAFEAAARHGSFSRASVDLNISETAISRKVRLLEAHYNLAFFVRGHRSVTLTPDGARLLASVSQSMDLLRDVSRDMMTRGKSGGLTLAATQSVASLWLVPKLRTFRRSNPRVRIALISSDDDSECLSEKTDLTILRGEGDWPGFDARLLFGETIFPVCSPAYLKRINGNLSLDRLHEMDLIEVSSAHAEWMNWTDWLDHFNLTAPATNRAVEFNTYPLSVQAAEDGLGIALGWGHLVDPLLESGALVRPLGSKAVRTRSGYYLLRRQGRKAFAEQRIVEDWLIRISEARRRYGA